MCVGRGFNIMFPLTVLNQLRLAEDVSAEVTPKQPGHIARVLVRPQVAPELAEWDQVRQRWRRIYVEENILAGFKVNYIELEAKQIENFYHSFEADLEPTINERFSVTSEDELASLVLRWTSDLSELRSYLPNQYPLDFDL